MGGVSEADQAAPGTGANGVPRPTRTASEVAAQYQEEFRRSAYQYDQDLSWWQAGAARAIPMPARWPAPARSRRRNRIRSSVAVWSGERSARIAREEEQIATLVAEKADRSSRPARRASRTGETLPTKEVPMACAVKEGETMDQKVFLRGDYHNLGDPVERTVPAILRLNAPAPPVTTNSGRLELANWMVDPRNPLPARVMANRIWQGHFGEGIVRTPDNFGRLGDRPSQSRTAGLPGADVHGERLVDQEDAPAHHAFEDLPDERGNTMKQTKTKIRKIACSRISRGSG